MNCPECQTTPMKPRMSTVGVELDTCGECGSLWFDRGEIFFFYDANIPALDQAIHAARREGQPGELTSPASDGEPMVRLGLPSPSEVHLDRKSGGVWVPGKAAQAPALSVSWSAATSAEPMRFKLPSLLARTLFTLTGLYAVLTLVLIAASLAGGLPAWTALIIAVVFAGLQYLVSPFLMDFFQRFAYSTRWVEFGTLPEHLRRSVETICGENQMKIPRFGIIPDMSPNAFTYGHTPNNARVIVTQGLFELLEPKELEAVVAHEIGHARNWDMALMTLAQLVPMVLYFVYRTLINVDSRDGRVKGATMTVAIGAFLLYIVSEYIVLWFSRTREYHADRFGGGAVGSPAALGRALVKIAYGLAGRGQSSGKSSAGSIGAMGIFDSGAAQTLALTSHGDKPLPEVKDTDEAEDGKQPKLDPSRYTIDPESLKGAMKWDLWNPWAMYHELNSTHPLVAKRLLHLSELSRAMGEEPVVVFDLPQPESYWDEFLVDVTVKLLPTALFVGGLIAAAVSGHPAAFGAGLVAVGMAMMMKLLFKYPGGSYPEMSVATLLRQVKVSSVRPVPCTLEGTVRGKGVPGLIWSDDFVMQDDTGILFLDHRQPLALWETIWGWLRGDKLVGGHVVVNGWYRRSPVPYLEINEFTVDGVRRRSWLRHFRWITAGLVLLGGGALLVMGLVPGAF